MNGEIAQVCNIVLASKSALKKRNGIKYRPAYYEKETEFVIEKLYHHFISQPSELHM